MNAVFIYVFVGLGIAALIAFITVALRLKASSKRISRSIDPIAQKSKNLKLEVSALQRSRLDRQRRLVTSSSQQQTSEK
jgi:hypothetical protein